MKTNKRVRKLVYRRIQRLDLEDQSTPQGAINYLINAQDQALLNGYQNCTIETAYDGSGDRELWLFGDRLETDHEFKERIKKEDRDKKNEENIKIKKEAAELKEYERLKKKFESK